MQQSREFQYYISLGDERSLLKVAKHFGVSKTAIAKRSKREEWQKKLQTRAIQKKLLDNRKPPQINLNIIDDGFCSVEELAYDEDIMPREEWIPNENNEINIELHLLNLIARTKEERLEIEKRVATGEALETVLNPHGIEGYKEAPKPIYNDEELVFIVPREPYSPLMQEKENRKALDYDSKVGEEMNKLAAKGSFRTIKIHRI